MTASPTEVAAKADFSGIRYAQCWEDADVLLDALDVQPGDACLSICSAGDNSLALLTRDPALVLAVDLSPAQLACLELRVAAYRTLDYGALLELSGSRPSTSRDRHYAACRDAIPSQAARAFWDGRREELAAHGYAGLGKLERYMALFRRYVLPLCHSRADVAALLTYRPPAERLRHFEQHWDGWRWRALFRLFCSQAVMQRLGRAPAFFAYAEGSVADHLLARARHALAELDPSDNPYVTWVFTGRHGDALPLALREDAHALIRARLDRLQWRQTSVEAALDQARAAGQPFHRFNLSDLFEYMSEEGQRALLDRLLAVAPPGARLAYWNMMVPRCRPPELSERLVPLADQAERLHQADKAIFYRAFVLEQVR